MLNKKRCDIMKKKKVPEHEYSAVNLKGQQDHDRLSYPIKLPPTLSAAKFITPTSNSEIRELIC